VTEDNDEQPPIEDFRKKVGRTPGVFDEAFLTDVPDVTEVLLIRHGQQQIDVENATTGDWIDPPLSERGHLQARLLAESLSTLKIDHIFCSPLVRARETAAPLAAMHRLEVEIANDLREVEVFRDLPPEQTARESLGDDLLSAVRRRMLVERNWDVYPYSESSFDFSKRAVNAIEAAIARNAGERIAVVCHGGVINAYTGHIIGSRYDMFFRPAHTAVNIVVAGGDRRVLRNLNDVHHLTTGEGDVLTY
jgi:broad specificity phosphatase PhoE